MVVSAIEPAGQFLQIRQNEVPKAVRREIPEFKWVMFPQSRHGW